MPVEEMIRCIECGNEAHLLSTFPPDAPAEPGDPIAYRCSVCTKRWDLIYEEDDGAGGDDAWFATGSRS